MRLVISTPTAVVVDVPDATAIRAEDDSGSFGILEGHANFLTVLSISILHWGQADGIERCCAMRHGVFSVTFGHDVRIATREAVMGTGPEQLETAVLARFREATREEQTARAENLRLQIAAIRRLIGQLRPDAPLLPTWN
jgi:F-type H+-transporting ATPase subunit epsilon